MVAITWIKPAGALPPTRLRGASSRRLPSSLVPRSSVQAPPRPYGSLGDVTRGLSVQVYGEEWSRSLRLSRDESGRWQVTADAEGEVDLPPPGGDPAAFAAALDCDLGECPVTNTMPVLRHRLLAGGEPVEFLMAWVSVPDLYPGMATRA